MNAYMDTLEHAFKQGCGLNMSDVLMSRRFMDRLERNRRALEMLGSRSDQMVAHAAGHQVFGELLNSVGEIGALKELRSREGSNTPPSDHKFQTLLWELGDCIIEAARGCFSETMVSLAKEWGGSDDLHRAELIKTLHRELISISQMTDRDEGFEALREKRESTRRSNMWDNDKILPHQYGLWNRDDNIANCQGKNQMLAAFAKEVGIKSFNFEPLRFASLTQSVARINAAQMVDTDLRKRGLVGPPEFTESTKAFRLEHLQGREDYFHVGSVFLVGNKHYQIDPHNLTCGRMSQRWEVGRSIGLLDKYRVALPGITHQCWDIELENRFHEIARERTGLILERSRRLEEKIHSVDLHDLPTLIQVLEEDEDFLWMAAGFNLDLTKIVKNVPTLVGSTILLGGEGMLDFSRAVMWANNPEFRLERIDSVLTGFHALVLNSWWNDILVDGTLIQPAGEVGNHSYQIGGSIFNSISDRYNREQNDVLWDNAFDQMGLYNMHMFGSREQAHVASQAVLSSTYQHPIFNKVYGKTF